MIRKKKYFTLFATFLLTLLLGCFGNCYASMDIGQIQNFIYNKSVLDNYPKQSLDDWFTGSTTWNSFKSDVLPYLTDNYDQLLLAQGYNIYVLWRPNETNYKIDIRTINTNSDPTTYNIRANGFKGFHFRYNDNTFYENNYTSTTFNSVNYSYSSANWFYNNSIYLNAPFGLPDDDIIEGEYYSSIIWQFVPNGSNAYFVGYPEHSYKLVSGGWGVDLGSLTDSEWCDRIRYRVAYYNKGLGRFGDYGLFQTIYDKNKNGSLYDYWSGSTTNDGSSYTTRITFDTYKFQNCCLELDITPSIDDLSSIYVQYYITNNYSVVNGGVIYPNLTFSGDYIGDYDQQQQENQNNDNTDKIVDTLTEFDSGDLSGVIDFGEEPDIEDPTSNFITYLIDRISLSFLNDYTNTYIDIPFYQSNTINSSYRVYARDFDFIPVALKTLIGMIFMIAFFKYYFSKIHDLVTAVQSAQIGSFAEKVKGGLNVTDIL